MIDPKSWRAGDRQTQRDDLWRQHHRRQDSQRAALKVALWCVLGMMLCVLVALVRLP